MFSFIGCNNLAVRNVSARLFLTASRQPTATHDFSRITQHSGVKANIRSSIGFQWQTCRVHRDVWLRCSATAKRK